jgi:putative endonuclease
MVVCSDGSLYTGWATNVEARIKDHNAGRGSQYCKQRRPVRMVYQEEVPSRSAAMKRELAIKRMRREKKLRLVAAFHRQEVPS